AGDLASRARPVAQQRRGGAREHAEAALATARASRTVGHRDVTELAGPAGRAAEDPAAHDQPAADAGAQRQAGDYAGPFTGAQPPLAEDREVAVVVHDHVRAERLAQLRDDRHIVPARQYRRLDEPAARTVDRPAHGDADAGHRPPAFEPGDDRRDTAKRRLRSFVDERRFDVPVYDGTIGCGHDRLE